MTEAPYFSHWERVRAAVVWDVLVGAIGDDPLDVVDVGGGTGGFAVPLARLGHRVTVVDPSPNSLATLGRRAADAGVEVRGVQGEAGTLLDLVEPADLVLCHGVLDTAEPAAVLATVVAAVRPGGYASLLVENRAAAVFARAVAGRFADAAAALSEPARGFGRAELLDLVGAAGLADPVVHGVRVFTDLVTGALLDADPVGFEELVALETAASGLLPYADVATQLHVLARRPPAPA